MKYWIFFLLGCCIGLPSFAWSIGQVERMDSVYEQEKDRIAATFRSERLSLPQRYITALRDLEMEAVLEGDQSRERMIREVRQQFVLSPTAKSLQPPGREQALENLQQQYQKEFASASRTHQEDLAILQEQYRAALSRLQVQLQQDGRDAALQRVERSLSALPEDTAAAEPDDDLIIDLGDDEPVATRRPEPADRTSPSSPRTPAPRRDSRADRDDAFDALMDAWLE